MADPGTPTSRPPPKRPAQRGGGIFIALGLVLGTVGGVLAQQPSVGLLTGLGLGIFATIVLALRDRR